MIDVAILGFGVVGSGVYEVINMNSDRLKARTGEEVRVKRILDLRDFSGMPFAGIVTKDINDITNDDQITVVVECMGGAHPAYDYSLAAIQSGKSVVTSNKEVVSKFGRELIDAARQKGVRYLFEASVGGGIPLIHPLCECISVNSIKRISGILNGTTNYILTRMFGNGVSFDSALAEAQQKGYAERNPAADVDGLDTARKICILSDLAYGKTVLPEQIEVTGIRNITSKDVSDASAYNSTIKLLGYSEKADDGVYCIVCPFFVKQDNILSGVNDVFNAVTITGNAVGEVAFYGKGAGKLPTASAMVSDIAEAVIGSSCPVSWTDPENGDKYIIPIKEHTAKIYLRFGLDSDRNKREDLISLFKSELRDNVSDSDECVIISFDEAHVSLITASEKESVIDEKASSACRLYGAHIESKIRVL